MSQPRYAPASFRFSIRQALFSATLLALGVSLGLPMVARAAPDRHQTAVDGVAPAAQAAGALPPTGGAQAGDIGRLVIHPLPVSTSQPAQPVAINDGVLGPAGDIGQLGIPTMVLHAYQVAAARLAVEQPACHLPWWLLAGIGHTESGHAESGRLYADGTTRGRILGPVLDGTLADNAIITDTDHGAYDGDPIYDRAVGPMQFIPSTWAHWGADGNHDGKKDPNNVYDATLAAGRYLCADGRNLATLPGLQAAVLAYNHSQPYLDTVLAWGLAYRNGASAVADLTAPVIGDVTKVRPPLTARPPKKPVKIAPPTQAGSSAPASTSAAASSTAAPSSSASATASPSTSCTSSAAPSSSAASSSAAAASGSADAKSASGQPASPASSADGGSATVSVSGSPAGASGSKVSAGPDTSTATPTPSDTASCTP